MLHRNLDINYQVVEMGFAPRGSKWTAASVGFLFLRARDKRFLSQLPLSSPAQPSPLWGNTECDDPASQLEGFPEILKLEHRTRDKTRRF